MDISKLLFYFTCHTLIILSTFFSGLFIGVYWETSRLILEFIHESVYQVYQLASPDPEQFLQPARYDGSGVTINAIPNDRKELIFLSGFFDKTNELRLIRRDGSIVRRWPVKFSKFFPDPSHLQKPPTTDWNIDTDGALIEPDGSVVFNFEYGGLVKLNRCGGVVWVLPYATHHSVESAMDGGYWVPGARPHLKKSGIEFPPFEPPFAEDTLLKVSKDGHLLTEISLTSLFYKNNLESLLTATGHSFDFNTKDKWDKEITHLNKIAELSKDLAADFPMFESGDLALSIRELNMVLVIDPDTQVIKWWKIGPWLRQHDPEFKSGGTIVIFNNNIYKTAFGKDDHTSWPSIPRVSNIVEIDPVTLDSKLIYGGRDGQEMLSVVRGKHELTAHDGLLVTEFEGGRVFETDAVGNIIWEYINRHDEKYVAEITEARVYPESYFRISNWVCNPQEEK